MMQHHPIKSRKSRNSRESRVTMIRFDPRWSAVGMENRTSRGGRRPANAGQRRHARTRRTWSGSPAPGPSRPRTTRVSWRSWIGSCPGGDGIGGHSTARLCGMRRGGFSTSA